MPTTLLRCIHHPLAESAASAGANQPDRETAMETIYRLLRDRYSIDFSYYKPNTVARRIERRLLLNQSLDLDDYVKRLEENSDELNLLYKDLLIGVTRFFRDREAFERLGKEVLPEALDASSAGAGIPGVGGRLRHGRRSLLAGDPTLWSGWRRCTGGAGEDFCHRCPPDFARLRQPGRLQRGGLGGA